MTYTYRVRLEINRFDNNDESVHEQEIVTNEFTHNDPLIAREGAFNRALSYQEILEESVASETETFFKDSKGWYKEFNVTVYFIESKTGNATLLHECNKTGSVKYDEIVFREILNSLKSEYSLLEREGNKIPDSMDVEVTFIPSKEVVCAKIIPTPFLNIDQISIQEIVL